VKPRYSRASRSISRCSRGRGQTPGEGCPACRWSFSPTEAERAARRRIAEAFPAAQVDLYGPPRRLPFHRRCVPGQLARDRRERLRRTRAGATARRVSDPGDHAQPPGDAAAAVQHGRYVRRFPTGFRILGATRPSCAARRGWCRPLTSTRRCPPFHVLALLPGADGRDRWDFQYVADHNAPPDIGDALAPVLGDGVRVNAFRRRFLQPAPAASFAAQAAGEVNPCRCAVTE